MTNQITDTTFDVMNFFMHRNYVVRKLIGGFEVCGKIAKTMGEVDRIIDEHKNKENERPKRTS